LRHRFTVTRRSGAARRWLFFRRAGGTSSAANAAHLSPAAGAAVSEADEAAARIMLTMARRDCLEQLLARMANVEAGIKALGWDPTEGF